MKDGILIITLLAVLVAAATGCKVKWTSPTMATT